MNTELKVGVHIDSIKTPYYKYNYGAGSSTNRVIFFLKSNKNKSYDLGEIWKTDGRNLIEKINQLSKENIYVEQMSTTQKFKALVAQRENGGELKLKPDLKWSKLSLQEQEKYLLKLDPLGPLRIEFKNDIGKNHFEEVVGLSIYDPS